RAQARLAVWTSEAGTIRRDGRQPMHWLNSVRKSVTIASLLALSALTGFAQSDRGTLAGTILDSSGAVVSGAAITATGVDTGSSYSATSSSSGAYRIQDMKLG